MFGKDARSCKAVDEAVAANEWFTREEICMAVEAIREEMLDRERLCEWLAGYDLAAVRPKRVAVIMAGNIPLVGFFDLLCTLASGHRAIVKPSGKDSVLMRFIVELLLEIEPQTAVEIRTDADLDPAEVDAVIATGSDNARRHFESAFAGKPQLLRGSRHSVAVLSGVESAAEIEGLQRDIFSYSGLGCRNVSLIFVPRGCRLRLTGKAANPKYHNNYLQHRALLRMHDEPFTDSGSCLLVAGEEFPTAISCVTLREYDSLAEVDRWLADHDDELQCVVSQCVSHSRRVPFGLSQRPRLTDYPDDVDVMKFLAAL